MRRRLLRPAPVWALATLISGAISLPIDGRPGLLLGVTTIVCAIATWLTRDTWPMSPQTRLARHRLAAARDRLAAITDIEAEDFAYRVANSAVIEAEQILPWWKRLDIEMNH